MLSTWHKTNNSNAKAVAATISVLRQPKRTAAAPDSGMVKSDPIPMHKSSMPSTSSPMASLSRKSGTNGAQEAAPKPPIKNKALVECCRIFPAAYRSLAFNLSLS